LSEKKVKLAGVGRFQVMALLQAARHYVLHGDQVRAKSFGLNRAIFYAWAKHHGPRRRFPSTIRIEETLRKLKTQSAGKTKCPEGFIEVLGECVEVSKSGYYMIGGVEQKPTDFDREVTWRIAKIMNPKEAWEKAIEYVKQFPKEVLEDPQKFYKLIYEPVRDTFIAEILEGKIPKPPKETVEVRKGSERKIERKAKTLLDFFT